MTFPKIHIHYITGQKWTDLAQPNKDCGQSLAVSHLSCVNLVGLNSLYAFVSTLSWVQGTNQDNLGFVHPTQASRCGGRVAGVTCRHSPWSALYLGDSMTATLVAAGNCTRESRCLLCHLLHNHRPHRLMNKAILVFQVHFLSLFPLMWSANVKCTPS